MAFEDDDRDRRDEGDAALSVSRRAFLKTVSASSLAAGVLSPAESEAQAGPAPVGPGDVPIELTIDGKTHALSVEPRVTLLDAMRDRLDITGHEARLRSRHLRRLHGDRRRAHALFVLAPRHRHAGRADPDRRRPDQGHRAPSRAAGVLRARRPDVRLLHAGLRRVGGGAARERLRTDGRRRRRPLSAATSAAAAPTPASSKRCSTRRG